MNKKLKPIISYKSFNPFDSEFLSLPFDAKVSDNLWLSLKAYSEIKESGIALLKRNIFPNPKKEELLKKWEQFRSFIRQAENYWEVAEKTAPKSQPLLYYYSFLNLTKAFLLLKGVDVSNNNIQHGLTGKGNSWQGKIADKKVKIWTTSDKVNVFTEYYKKIFDQDCFESIKIDPLFSYMNTIAFEYQQIYKQNLSSHPFKALMPINDKLNKCWMVIAIAKSFKESEYWVKNSIKQFNSNFEKIVINQMDVSISTAFGFKKEDWTSFNFFELKEDNAPAFNMGIGLIPLKNLFVNTFKQYTSPPYAYTNYDGYINKPIFRSFKPYPFNEEMAIYVLMFFLSELVRYHPYYLDEIFEGKEHWLIQAFLKNSPTYFLNAISSRITRKVEIYT